MADIINNTAGKQAEPAVPRHIAIILDGNGRWAKKRGLPRTAGHMRGAENFRKIATYCKNIGVEYLTVYAFSTENWKRPEDEVGTIMKLLGKYLEEAIRTMEKDHIRMKVFGELSRLSPELQAMVQRTDEISQHYQGFQANICLNYGGRDEIVHAVRRYAQDCVEGKVQGELTEARFGGYLYSAGIPDPDLLIRPGGEMRISNFLLWQCAYSEFYFTDVLWPDFTPAELDKAIAEFRSRDRRFGGVKKSMTDIQRRLFALRDEKYRAFTAALIPTVPRELVIGVRTPALRALAKELKGSAAAADFMKALPHEYYEENDLHAALIGQIRDFEPCLEAVEGFLPFVDNWATCDMLRPKALAKNKEKLMERILLWLRSGHTYTVRFAMGMLMSHFLDADFREEHLALVASVQSEEYYVRMMQAWYFATALAKQYDAAVGYIEGKKLETWVHNKTIQKSVESFRVSGEHKEYLKSLKIR